MKARCILLALFEFNAISDNMDNPETKQISGKHMSDSYYVRLAIRMAGEFGVTIAAPAVVAALVGVRLDSKWGSEPWALVALLIIAFLSTGVWILKRAKFYKTLYEKKPTDSV